MSGCHNSAKAVVLLKSSHTAMRSLPDSWRKPDGETQKRAMTSRCWLADFSPRSVGVQDPQSAWQARTCTRQTALYGWKGLGTEAFHAPLPASMVGPFASLCRVVLSKFVPRPKDRDLADAFAWLADHVRAAERVRHTHGFRALIVVDVLCPWRNTK